MQPRPVEEFYANHATAPQVADCESYFLQNIYQQRLDTWQNCEIPQFYYPFPTKSSPPFEMSQQEMDQLPTPRSSSDPVQYSKCMVCDDIADGYHFNALSCAACSAFFRRSIADQKNYSCVMKNCSVSINTRKHGVICRYCRFQKCIIAGMIPDEVQCKRIKPGATAPYPQPSKELTYRARTHRNNGSGNGPGSVASSGSRSPRTPLLNEITNARREVGQNRLTFMNFPPISRMASFTQQRNSLFSDVGLFRNYTRLIGALSHLDINEETVMHDQEVRNLFILWLLVETTFCTVRFGGVQTNRIYFGNLCFLDVGHQALVTFFSDGNIRDPECMARFSYPMLEYFLTSVSRAVQGIKLDEKEIAGLSALLFFGLPPTSNNDPQIHPQNQERRQQVFQELADHYRFSEHDIALRMGNLVMLMSTFEEMFFMIKEFISSIEIFASGQNLIF
uniref:Uncharacterized protein n=1 Tax=Acrobeloides nanus TaxID=290746 RepID=A0A914CAH5_9BILA